MENQNCGHSNPFQPCTSSNSDRANLVHTQIADDGVQSQLDRELEEFLGEPYIGEFVPQSFSTPIAGRSKNILSFNDTGREALPIERDKDEQQDPSVLMARRRLFQDSASTPELSSSQQIPTPAPKKVFQPSIKDVLRKMSEKKTKNSSTVGFTHRKNACLDESLEHSPTLLPPETSQDKRGKKRRKSGNTYPNVQSKKLKNHCQIKTKGNPSSGGRCVSLRPANDSGVGDELHPNRNEDSSESADSTYVDSSYSDTDYDSGDEQTEPVRETVPHFSIHRLPVDQLQKRFEDDRLTENDIIEQIMDDVNEDLEKRYKGNKAKFEKQTPQNIETVDDTFTSFCIEAYIQKVEATPIILAKLGIAEKQTDVNFIIFYHRKSEIYALTAGQTWQAIQRYCCYDFPCLISGRLTCAEGNLEETKKQLAGNVRLSKDTKKNATTFDQLKNIRINVIKELRRKSSLYRLREFKSSRSQESSGINFEKSQVKIQMGLAYVRIKRNIDLKNLPEILDHFSKICNGEQTLSYPDGKPEKIIDEFPPIGAISKEEAKEVTDSFYELIQKFMHNERKDLIRKFDFVDKHIDDFCSAEEFKVIYNKGKEKIDIATFVSCPAALEVLTAVRSKCENLTKNTLSLPTFRNLLNNCVRIQYKVRGRLVERRIADLMEGELSIYDKDYWRIMGKWFFVRECYYYQIYKEFRDLLNKPGLYVSNEKLLPESWDRSKCPNTKKYVQLYEKKQNYYLPPTPEAMEEMSSQSERTDLQADDDNPETSGNIRNTEENHYFDLIRIKKYDKGEYSFHLFYIFDGFDNGIRDASTRIQKSIRMLLKDEPTTSSKSLLQKFWEYNHARNRDFASSFINFESFLDPITRGNKVFIVVAVNTAPKHLQTAFGPMGQYCQRQRVNNIEAIKTTLEREKNLELNFNQCIVEKILYDIYLTDPDCVNEMCEELEIVSDSDSETGGNLESLSFRVLSMMMSKGYCTGNSVGTDMPVTGKLLKMRDHAKFKLFRNEKSNEIMFNTIRQYFITGFPGFIHKLECLQIYESVTKEPRLNLNFTEINN